MGQEPYPKFAILVNGEVRIADDVVDVDLPGEVSKARGVRLGHYWDAQ